MRLRAQHYREKQGWREGCLDRDLVDQSARERLGKTEKGREARRGLGRGAGPGLAAWKAERARGARRRKSALRGPELGTVLLRAPRTEAAR